jgi:hypothetical protein
VRSVTITDTTLEALLGRKELVAAIPMLATLALQVRPKSDCCGRSSGRRQGLQQAKQRLMGLPAGQRAILRQALNADELVVYVPSSRGSTRVVI